jgi:hypothetical protein
VARPVTVPSKRAGARRRRCCPANAGRAGGGRFRRGRGP